MERERESGLFSGSLEVIIRTDGHHWNPLTASPFVPDGEPDDVSPKEGPLPRKHRDAPSNRSTNHSEIVRGFHGATCVLQFMSRRNAVDRCTVELVLPPTLPEMLSPRYLSDRRSTDGQIYVLAGPTTALSPGDQRSVT